MTEVIVYRSPLEKMLWDFWLGPQGCGIIAWLSILAIIAITLGVLWSFLERPVNRLKWKWRQRKGIGGKNYYAR